MIENKTLQIEVIFKNKFENVKNKLRNSKF